MKKVMFALCFVFGGVVALNAQDTQDTTSNQYRTETESQYPQDQAQQQNPYQQPDRERIQSTELPDEVKRALEGEEYRGWLISGAFKAEASDDQSMQSPGDPANQDPTNQDPANQENQNDPSNRARGAQGEEIYIVELKNGAETKTVRFDENGQKLEGMDDMNQNSQFNQDQDQNQNQNQNNQYQSQDPDEEAGQTDPGSTTDPTEQTQPDQSTETRPEIQTPETESSETGRPDQSTETQSSQSTQTDQSGADQPE